MKEHGNSRRNPNAHHLYDIHKIRNRDIFKYGITDDEIEADGLSARVRTQVGDMNLAAEYKKYEAEILIQDIPGRAEALRIERQFIDAYFLKHGRNPKGNKIPVRK